MNISTSEIDTNHTIQPATYAVTSASATGRRFAEPSCQTRTEFQRDRDRIIHCTAFRRLEYKTQVFINHEGDLYRTRLTHSLEVAQIARSVARALHLNEDLTEAVALAHDLGHTAFGHAGQDALHHCMLEFGGFEHNFQSLRVVDKLEEKYPQFNGLNLMFDTREGILKHCSLKNAATMGQLGERFIQRKQPSLEAQLTNVADEIAYNNHDIDDGLRSGLLAIKQLKDIELFDQHYQQVKQSYGQLNDKRIASEVIRGMINSCVEDLIKQTIQNLCNHNITSLQDVRNMKTALVEFSPGMKKKTVELKHFLYQNLYQHQHVQDMNRHAKQIITELFHHYFNHVDALPEEHKQKALVKKQTYGQAGLARIVADYIAGMTDRYAELEHQRIISRLLTD